ncbi:MAG TPA: glycosyltransferase family 4 protein [Thermoplasmata archaeon]|nr:glycosyltransferase family 4 protein [Thermoplasmata archaeon]
MTDCRPRIALLTPHGSTGPRGGVEVFNDHMRRTLGNLEVFAHPRLSPNHLWNLDRIGLEQPARALALFRGFLREHRARPFDLVLCNGLSGWPLSFRRLDVPTVVTYHFTMAGLARHALPFRGDRFTTGTVGAFFDRVAGYGKQVVAVSARIRRELEQYYGLHSLVIPNFVDTGRFRGVNRERARKALGLPEEPIIGLFVGRAEYAKGFDILIDVARVIPDHLFLVAGASAQVAEPNVRVLGQVAHERMPLCYSAADYFFLPSRYEGFNLSLLEALACDCPIVVADAAYPFEEDASRYGHIVTDPAPQGYVEAIRTVEGKLGTFRPREALSARHSFEAFQSNWRSLVDRLLNHGHPHMWQLPNGGGDPAI